MFRNNFVLIAFLLAGSSTYAADIVHDGEYRFLRAQYGEQWDAEDQEIDGMLAEAQGLSKSAACNRLIRDSLRGAMAGRTNVSRTEQQSDGDTI